jgi:hypothetical protein
MSLVSTKTYYGKCDGFVFLGSFYEVRWSFKASEGLLGIILVIRERIVGRPLVWKRVLTGSSLVSPFVFWRGLMEMHR